MYKRILIPTDGSACSEVAVKHGLSMAKSVDAEVTFLYVIYPLPPAVSVEAYGYTSYAERIGEDFRRAGRDILDGCLELAQEAGVRARTKLVENARAADAIVTMMAIYDLVVMGSHGRSGVIACTARATASVRRLLLGSVTESVMRQSTKPLLVVHCLEP